MLGGALFGRAEEGPADEGIAPGRQALPIVFGQVEDAVQDDRLKYARGKRYAAISWRITDFNVDHVIIGPAGAFTIETKTWNKPGKGSPKITFDGETLLAAGWDPDRNPVIQAKAQASWLQRLLAESTGKTLPVKPVILFPGWYIEDSRQSRKELWVLEPKALAKFLENAPSVVATRGCEVGVVSPLAFHSGAGEGAGGEEIASVRRVTSADFCIRHLQIANRPGRAELFLDVYSYFKK